MIMSDDRIARLEDRRRAILAKYRDPDERLSVEDDADFRRLTDRIDELRLELDDPDRQATASARLVRRAQAEERGDRVYTPGGKHSYFRDLLAAGVSADPSATRRLAEHVNEARALNRTDGTGGAFVPPLWLMNQFVELARPGRVAANLCDVRTLPGGTDEMKIPKFTSGGSVDPQTGDNAAISSADPADTALSLPVRTIAGRVVGAQQLLDQSPAGFDELIFRDLVGDYASKLNKQVIAGTGANGQLTGITTTAGITTLAYTDTTPTVLELLPKINEAISTVASLRFQAPTVIVMHPRRWAWILNSKDTQNRPLVTPSSAGPTNAAGVSAGFADGLVGELGGLPVYADAGIPTNLGAGTNEDVILVMKADDLVLYESSIRTRILPLASVASDTLTVELQVYGYLAFSAARYPQSVVQITGTGLTPPTFV